MNEARETVNTNNTISIFPRPDDEQEQPQRSSKPPWVKLFELLIYAVAGLIGFKIFLEYLK